MRRNGRIAGAIILSVLFHGLLLVWTIEIPAPPPAPVVLDLVLAAEPPTPEAIPEEKPATEAHPDPTPDPPPDSPMEQITELPTDIAVEPEVVPVPPAPLNLTRHSDWDEVVADLPNPDVIIHFNPTLREGVALREGDKRRKALVAARVAAVYGVPDELYTREGPLGTEIKLNGKCYILSNQPSIEAGTRWWRTPCMDAQQNPFTLAPIEYDAIGRVVAD